MRSLEYQNVATFGPIFKKVFSCAVGSPVLPPTFPSFFSTNFSTLKLRFPLLPSFSSPNIHSHRFWVIMMGREEKTVNLGRKIKPLSTIKVGRETQSRVYTTGFFLGVGGRKGLNFWGVKGNTQWMVKLDFFTLFSALFGYKNGKPQLVGSEENKNRLCSKTCGGYEIFVTKVIRRSGDHFNISKIEHQLDQECWIPVNS